MKFGQVEAAAIAINDIREDRIDAFKARIRNLRNFNCPNIEKGPGRAAAEYSRANAIELAIALALQVIGMPPKFCAETASFWTEDIVDKTNQNGERYLVVMPGFNSPALEDGGVTTIAEGTAELLVSVEELHAMCVVNVSKIVRDLDAALVKADE